ncbi:hypothetical protein BD779DRAFT_281697 [Infundibulicybe gibba]|nr:hypothetical protein BD779DRAFT_281697 [Infundibulicybe gibba]
MWKTHWIQSRNGGVSTQVGAHQRSNGMIRDREAHVAHGKNLHTLMPRLGRFKWNATTVTVLQEKSGPQSSFQFYFPASETLCIQTSVTFLWASSIIQLPPQRYNRIYAMDKQMTAKFEEKCSLPAPLAGAVGAAVGPGSLIVVHGACYQSL